MIKLESLFRDGVKLAKSKKSIKNAKVKLPKCYFKKAVALPQNPDSTITTPINEYVRQNLHLVGKGSNYQKTLVKDYLAPLTTHPLRRQDIQNNYDNTKGINFTKNERARMEQEKTGSLGFTVSQQFVGELLANLMKCTQKEYLQQTDYKPTQISYSRYSTEELPKLPDFESDPEKFGTYIGVLTHTKFLYKKSSKSNGVIPKILRNLIHPSNVKTMHLRNTDVFNDLIYFFSEKYDFASCRELFSQMKIEGNSPNTKTYNLMLRTELKNLHRRKIQSGNFRIIYYLKDMRKHGVNADSITWTTCYNFLSNDISRDLFIEQMMQSGIDLTDKLFYTIMKNGDYEVDSIVRYLRKLSIPINAEILDLCLSKLIEKNDIEIAWQFMNIVRRDDMKARFSIRPVNKFLRVFAEWGRLDLVLLTFNTYVKKYHIHPNENSIDMLFKALVKNGYTKNFTAIFYYFKNLKKTLKIDQANTYWITKANSIAIYNMKSDAAVKDQATVKELLDEYFWKSEYTDKTWKYSTPEDRKILRFLGSIPKNYRSENQSKKSSSIISSDSIAQKKANYRRRVKFIALQNAMASRIPFAKDSYSALKDELAIRGIIDREK